MRGAALRSLTRLLRYVAVAVLAVVIIAGAGAAFTQTSWFKNWLRLKAVSQAAQYLNGELTIDRLGGTIFTGVALEGVTLRHEGQRAVAIGRLTVDYSPLTMISEGLILDSLRLDNPTILLERNERGWNFNRFVKTRQNTGGRGAPPLTLASVVISNGHLIVKDRGQLVEDLTRLDTAFRFAYEKPGIAITIGRMTAAGEGTAIRSFSGDLRFDRGAISARSINLRTNRSTLAATVTYQGPRGRQLDVQLDAERLSLPEIGHYFRPLATIGMEPAVSVRGRGTLDALAMDVRVESPAGSARGPLVGHFGAGPKSLEGTLDVRDIDMAPILNRVAWKTRVTGRAEFAWTFSPAQIDFTFAGPQVEGFGYRAASVRAKGKYEPAALRFDAAGAAYGARATARGDFRFATRTQPLTYTLDGTFRDLDMRRLPERLSMPKLETRAAGRYTFGAAGANWRADAVLDESTVENAQFGPGTTLALESRRRVLGYSANGSVAGLDPRRFARPLDIDWLDDERFSGSLTGSFTFDGSGRSIDDLTLATRAALVDSTLAQAGFPTADVSFRMAEREMHATFTGPFEHLPGSLFSERKELADTTLNGTADMAVTLALPKSGSVEFLGATGTTTLSESTIAGTTVESGQFTGSFENRTLDIKELLLTGPDVSASATGSLATGETGESKLSYEVTVTNVGPIAKKFEHPVQGSARVKGEATGPASNLTIAGTLDANRIQYGTNFDALTATTKYTVQLPNFEIEQSKVQADLQATFVTIAGTRLPRVTAQTTYAKNDLQFDALMEDQRRTLGAGGNLLFHPDHDELHLRALNLKMGTTEWVLPQGQEATAEYSEDSIHIENFVLQRGEQQLAVAGTVAVGPGSENLQNTLNARFDNVQIQDINEVLLGDRKLSGLLDASAVIRGTRNNPIVQTDFEITQGMAEGVAFNSLAGKADYSGKAVDLDARLDQSASATLTAVGTVPVPNGPGQTARTDEFDLTVKSSPIDIALFQPATTQLTKLTGQLSANLQVGGTLEAPTFNGLVETTNGGFTVAATGVAYHDAIARLIFENDQLLVDRFELTDNGQDRLVAIGQLGIVRRKVGEMNMQIAADGFQVLNNQFGSLEIDTDLRVTGDAAKPQITGEILTDAGRVEVDRLLEELTRSPYRTEAIVATQTDTAPVVDAAPTPEEQRGLYDAATIDVHLRIPDDLVLRGRDMHASFSRIGLGDMNITAGGELQIRKAPAGEPDVVGTVTVVRGFYDFQGRRFEVLRDSQIRFQGTRPVDPALQVDAERQINAVTAIVNIRGTARQPQVRLSSQPPLDEADVLSLIVFNQPINQLGEGERLNLAERAGGLAAGYLASPLANSISRALDLDLFEIRASGGESGQPSIAVGQQIGSRLFVSFRQEFGSQDYMQVSFEYRINELLRLVSTVTQGSQRSHRTQRLDTTGLDFYYTISY